MIRQYYARPTRAIRSFYTRYFSTLYKHFSSDACRFAKSSFYRMPQMFLHGKGGYRCGLSLRRKMNLALSVNLNFFCNAHKRLKSDTGRNNIEDGKDSEYLSSDIDDLEDRLEKKRNNTEYSGKIAGMHNSSNSGEDVLDPHSSAWNSNDRNNGEDFRSFRHAYPPSAVELPESSLLKCIEKEIMDEKLRLDKEEGPPSVPIGWELHHAEGTSFFYGRRLWIPPRTTPYASSRTGNEKVWHADASSRTTQPHQHQSFKKRQMEKHFIRVQLTTRDASLDPECDIRGEHVPFSFFIQTISCPNEDETIYPQTGSELLTSEESLESQLHLFDESEVLSLYRNSIEVRLDVIEGELVVDNVVFHGNYSEKKATAAGDLSDQINSIAVGVNDLPVEYSNPFGGYPGPNLDEAEEEVLDGVQAWLAERNIDDQFAEFVGQYSLWVEQMEYERWLQKLYEYVAA